MIRTYEATIDEKGNIRVLNPVRLAAGRRVLVTVLDEPVTNTSGVLSSDEEAPADRNRPEEDAAWFNLFTHTLDAAYGENEPDYPLTAIKEPNPIT